MSTTSKSLPLRASASPREPEPEPEFHSRDDHREAYRACVLRVKPANWNDAEQARIHRRLVPEARLQLSLTRNWNVWAVLADDGWAENHRQDKAPPNRKSPIANRQ
jgi:hypothetical protein